MNRSLAELVGGVLLVGIGIVIGSSDRKRPSYKPADEETTRARQISTDRANLEPVVTEVAILFPDKSERKFAVLHSGTNVSGAGVQKSDEYGVTLWYQIPQGDNATNRVVCMTYFGAPVP